MSNITDEIKRQIKENQPKTGLIKMADIEPKEVDWLWYPYIPLGKITLMRGDPGQGKTTVSLTLTSIVSNGLSFPNTDRQIPQKACNSLYISAEDGLADTIAPRLIKSKANMDKVFSYEESTIEPLYFVSPKFEQLIKESQAKLVIVDPIQAYMGANVDGNKSNVIRPVMRHIGILAEKYNCAIVLIEHMSKNTGVKGLYRGLGSIDTTAAARSVLLVGSNPKDEADKGIVQIKSNLAKQGSVVGFSISDEHGIVWKEETYLTEDILLGVIPTKDSKNNSLEEAKMFLKETLQNGKQSSKYIYDMAKEFNISQRTLKRAKEELNIDCSEREGFGNETVVYWKLTL